MIELLIIKAIVGLYARHRVHLQPRADVISLVTVSSVCSEWRAIISGSRRNRQKIKNILMKTKVSFSDS
jgi:hypothetical protein